MGAAAIGRGLVSAGCLGSIGFNPSLTQSNARYDCDGGKKGFRGASALLAICGRSAFLPMEPGNPTRSHQQSSCVGATRKLLLQRQLVAGWNGSFTISAAASWRMAPRRRGRFVFEGGAINFDLLSATASSCRPHSCRCHGAVGVVLGLPESRGLAERRAAPDLRHQAGREKAQEFVCLLSGWNPADGSGTAIILIPASQGHSRERVSPSSRPGGGEPALAWSS